MGEIIDLTAARIERLTQTAATPEEKQIAHALLDMYMQGDVAVTYDRGEMLFKLMEPLNEA